MAYIGDNSIQYTSSEVDTIIALNALSASSSTQAIQKTGASTFANVEIGGLYTLPTASDTVKGGIKIGNRLTIVGDILSADIQPTSVGPATINEIAYFDSATTINSLPVSIYPSLTELSYVKGVTSAIQTQINAKAPSTSPTFATSITGSYLTASEILITDGSKNIVSASVATYPSLTELSYIKGLSSAIQTQLNGKQASDAQLTSLAGLSYVGNSLKVIRVNVGETDFELASGLGDMVLADIQSVTGLKTFDKDKLAMKGTSTGVTIISTANTSATSYTATLQAGDGTIAYLTDIPVVTGFATKALDNLASVAINTTLVSDTDNTDSLGTTAIAWSDLFLGNGAVITFNSAPSTADVTITHSANTLTLAGGDLIMATSLGATATRVLKGWFTDLEITNLPTINGGTLATALSLGTMASETATNYVAKSLFDANTVLYATSDNTPVALTVTEQTLVGRATGGNISAIVIDSDLSAVSANDDTVPSAKATKAMGDLKLPLAGGTMSGNITLGENTSIDLDPAGSADGKYSGTCITGTAGAALAFGDLIYLDPTDSRWELADANSAAAADGDARGILGICVLAAAGDGSATKILLFGIVRADTAFPAMTINAPMYVSETAGDITGTIPTTTDAVQRSVGTAITADELYFFPSPHYQTAV
jgi:hypothetical protein